MNHFSRKIIAISFLGLEVVGLSGCLAAAAGVGAETAYVATQDDRNTSEILTDQRITATIKTKLLASQAVSGLDINVDTHKAVVTLRGFVDSKMESDKAEQLAYSVSGVKDVKTNLVLK